MPIRPAIRARRSIRSPVAGNGIDIGVRIGDVQRALDQYVQRQLRTENSGANYADTRAQLYSRLQDIYGQPGSDNALETVYNNFTNALQALSTSPDDSAARSSVISSAQLLAQQLNQMSNSIQGLRGDAELGISDAVTQANNAMTQIAAINQKLAGASSKATAETATLLDQRDAYIDQLSQLMDINVIQGDNNQVSIFTRSGIQLVGNQAGATLLQCLWHDHGGIRSGMRTRRCRTVGTITLVTPAGKLDRHDPNHTIRSGTIAAYVQMRDQDLVQAQNQLDAFAAAMASALSDKTTAGTAVTAGAQSGFDIDIGSSVGRQHDHHQLHGCRQRHSRTPLTLVRVDDPVGAAAVQQRDHRSQRHGGRHRLLRRHGLGDHADQRRARRNRHDGFQSVRHDAGNPR